MEKNLFETTVATLDGDDHPMRVWMALLGCFTGIERTLRKRFATAFHSSLPRYDVLSALNQSPDGLTMGQLAQMLVVSKGNITGVVRRLQEHQYVRQTTSRKDRRVQLVKTTAKGRALWREMHTQYRAVIDEMLADLGAEQSRALVEALGNVQSQIDSVLDTYD